jgi:hypothetical protein
MPALVGEADREDLERRALGGVASQERCKRLGARAPG